MPRLEQKEYLELFDKIFKEHSYMYEENRCHYDRFIYDVFNYCCFFFVFLFDF